MTRKEKFINFIERIFESSRLEIAAGKIQQAFKEEIFLNAEEIHKYIKQMEDLWENWKKKSGTDFISRFIEDLGPKIFKIWLSSIFPFDLNQIEATFPKGLSSVDSLLQVSYSYNKNELKVVNNLIIKHNIAGKEEDVASTLFIEAIKSISESFSKIIKQQYKIFTSDVNIIRKGKNLIIEYRGAGRIEK